MTCCHWDSFIFWTAPVALSTLTSRPSRKIPALFTRALRPPRASWASWIRRTTSSSLATLATKPLTLPGRPAASASTAAIASGLRSQNATSAPSRARFRVNALPMPLAPPVTRALIVSSFMLGDP